MGYCTEQDLVDRFGNAELLQLADRDNNGTADSAVTAQALADADAVIDSYLKTAGYTVPISPVPAVIELHAANLARYFLMGALPTEAATDRYNQAIAWLKDIAAGRASLGGADETAETGLRVVTAQGESAHDWDTY